MSGLFKCPQCLSCDLQIIDCLEIGTDRDWDEITLQIVCCIHCDFTGAAVFCESRRGFLASESWSHRAYLLKKADLKAMQTDIRRRPEPRKSDCGCDAHKKYGITDSQNVWGG